MSEVSQPPKADDIHNRIDQLLTSNHVVLFMKGSPQFPMCGFSARAVAILQELGTEFYAVDVIQDNSMREGIKVYGKWPTIPQLYVKKELVGGSDIMMEMFQSGELKEMLAQ
jgi:monothiol glutaredoxin